jgi:late competence protein required for DNA uptake (superfamily II DNA/RNA helicase)
MFNLPNWFSFGKKKTSTKGGSSAALVPKTYIVDEDYPCLTVGSLPIKGSTEGKIKLTQIQSCFYENYDHAKNCIVSAPTGTGKSVLIYVAARRFLNEGRRVILTAPTRKLVKDLYAECMGIFGSKITGLNTGQDKTTSGKYIVVSTPEGYLSAVRAGKEWTKASLLIIDEAHMLFDVSRGGDLDVAMTIFIGRDGKVLCLSGTFINKEYIAAFLQADIFEAVYRRTQIIEHEVLCPDDFDAESAPKTSMGYSFNAKSIRLHKLKEILKKNEGDSILIFVPTKVIGFALSRCLDVPFHCADVPAEKLREIELGFNDCSIKTLIATTTLAAGVNTPCDTVVQFGTRIGSSFMDSHVVEQIKGRGGRGKNTADFFLIGDEVEIFHYKNIILTKSIPVPYESMVMTMLATDSCSSSKLVESVGSTLAASFVAKEKITDLVEGYLKFLRACNILLNNGSLYGLTQEGILLARYYIYPKAYIGYVKLARELHKSGLPEEIQGQVIMSYLFPEGKIQDCPGRLALNYKMKLAAFLSSGDFSGVVPEKAALYAQFIKHPTSMPDYLPWKLKDAERWVGMMADMQKYGVHKEPPGLAVLKKTLMELKQAAAKAESIRAKKSKKSIDNVVPLFSVDKTAKTDPVNRGQAAPVGG